VKFLAKLASEAAKPKASPTGPRFGPGVVIIDPSRETEFLHPMPVRALWGVGPATLVKLERLGIATVGHLAETPLPHFDRRVGESLWNPPARLGQRGRPPGALCPVNP
jgi:DNA polymerase-4